jgi:eukaryotic-like serine/threonine-protein kinase
VTTFGRYEILDKLGEGAMGIVYRARDPSLGRVVALKMLSNELGGEDELHQRFQREAETIGRLSHPNIVTVYDRGESESQLYMAMELLEGDDLRWLIERGFDIPLVDRVRFLVQICDGLSYAHSRGVIHRDIKPANIMVTASGAIKILDFGLARVETRATITRRGVILGTPDYMSPEQAMGKPVDQRSDMFSAGAVFYEFLTRQKPFKGKTLHGVLYQIVSEEPDPVLTVVPETPARVAAVVHGMMRKEPEKRYASMEEVGRILRGLHASLRRSRSRSALPRPASPAAKDRGRLRDSLARGRGMLEEGRYARVLSEMEEALALDPECDEAFELSWRARRKQQGGGRQPERSDPANEKRVVALLAKMRPGASDSEARGALAELALIAPDDPRVNDLLRERAGRDR